MRLDYTLIDPTGNLTILVDTPVSPAQQPALAGALMAREPLAEQVGFLRPGDGDCDLALRMAGGEFCGNASISAAALCCQRQGRSGAALRLRVSGAAAPVEVEVCRLPHGDWLGTVTMPPAAAPTPVTLPLEDGEISLPLVDMGGIRHLVLTEPLARETAERAVRCWCALLGAPALGLMQLDTEQGSLLPLVYVPGADTMYWESSCASGTTAVGCYLAWQQGKRCAYRFAQPGGILEITADPDGRAILRGTARILHGGSLETAEAGR